MDADAETVQLREAVDGLGTIAEKVKALMVRRAELKADKEADPLEVSEVEIALALAIASTFFIRSKVMGEEPGHGVKSALKKVRQGMVRVRDEREKRAREQSDDVCDVDEHSSKRRRGEPC